MADLAQLPFPTRAFLKAYRWRRIDPVPRTPLTKPLGARRVALVSTAGLVPPGAPPFDAAVRGGDSSFRVVSSAPTATPPATLTRRACRMARARSASRSASTFQV